MNMGCVVTDIKKAERAVIRAAIRLDDNAEVSEPGALSMAFWHGLSELTQAVERLKQARADKRRGK